MIKTDNMMEKMIKHCLSFETSKEELECFNKNYAPFLYMIDKKLYWKVVEDINSIHNFTLQTTLENKTGEILVDVNKVCGLQFTVEEIFCFLGDSEQKNQIKSSIKEAYVYEKDGCSFVRVCGELCAGFSIDCDMVVTFYDKKEAFKECNYIKLFTEEQGIFAIDVWIPISKETVENIHRVKIVCKYR